MPGCLGFLDPGTAIGIVKALIAFAFLILVHELGHYLAAKAVGVRVERFSLGFGRKLVGFTHGGTEYQIAVIPYGGYVKLYGEIEDPDSKDKPARPAAADPESFLNQPAWKRAVVFVAGSSVNFLVAIPLLTLTYLNGINVIEAKIGTQISPESVLYRAGLRPGDEVKAVNDRPIDSFRGLREQLVLLERASRPVRLLVNRAGQELSIAVTEPGPMASMDDPPFFITTEIGQIERDSPARQAGLQVGDRVTRIGDQAVQNWPEMVRIVQASPGKTLDVVVERQDERGKSATLTLAVPVGASEQWKLGVEPIVPAVISAVDPGRPADKSGLKPGDRVIAIDGQAIEDFQALADIVKRSTGKELVFTVERGGREVSLIVVPEGEGENGGRIGIASGGALPALSPLPGSPAEAAGVKRGDIPISFAGQPIKSWEDLTAAVESSAGTPGTLVVRRGTALETLTLAAVQFQIGELGVLPRPAQRFVRYGLFGAIRNGTAEAIGVATKTYQTVALLVTGRLSAKYLAGPVGIVYLVTFQAREGLSHLLQFVAFITVNLAVLNLLPLPILDGGNIVFLGVEKLIGRRIPLSVQVAVQYVGLFILVALMLLVTSNDLFNFVFGRSR